jgi:hypothetical protein
MTPASPHLACASPKQRTRTPECRVGPLAVHIPQAGPNSEPRPSGLTPLKSLLPQIGITQRALKKLEIIQLVREQRERGKQQLAYNVRPFVLCGIPLRRLPSEQLSYARHNGRFFLEITAHPRFGLPTVRADCTCVPLAFGMGRNISSLPPAARSAI